MFLQTPSRWFVVPFFNPQCLELPPVAASNGGPAGGPRIDSGKLTSGTRQIPDLDDEDVLNLDDIMNGVHQFTGSGELQIDKRISTTLLPYVVS